MAREERTFWTINSLGELAQHTGLSCAPENPDMWWFPTVGQPGWGTSLKEGHGCFVGRDDAIAYALRSARQSLIYAQERVEKLEKMR